MVLTPESDSEVSPFVDCPVPAGRSAIERLTGAKRPDLARQALQHLFATHSLVEISSTQVEQALTSYGLKDADSVDLGRTLWRSAFEALVADGRLEKRERNYLFHLRRLLDVSEDFASTVEQELVGSRFDAALRAAIAGGSLPDTEIAELHELASRLGIDARRVDKDLREAKQTLLRSYVANLKGDAQLSPTEVADLGRRLADAQLTLSPTERTQIDVAGSAWRAWNEPLVPIEVALIVEPGELCYLRCETTWSEMRKRRVHGQSVDELTPVESGTLYVTNRRALFKGSTKSSVLSFSEISGFKIFRDAIRVERTKGRHVYFIVPTADVYPSCIIFARARNGTTGDAAASRPPSVSVAAVPVPPRSSGTGSLDQLKALVGLDSVKTEVTTLTNLVRIQVARRAQGLPVAAMTHHLVFTGNPGTGKTTVARIVASIFRDLGVLSKGQVIEVDRAKLVGGYVGQTAIKTAAVVESAIGGVLFIDEAYSLATGGDQDFGAEAIDTLLKAMEDRRDQFIVIAAGYSDLMTRFMESNPGLKSRFGRTIEFPDYGPSDLVAILRSYVEQSHYALTPEAETLAISRLNALYAARSKSFANARTVRSFFERMLERQSNRLASDAELSQTDLVTLEDLDVPEIEGIG